MIPYGITNAVLRSVDGLESKPIAIPGRPPPFLDRAYLADPHALLYDIDPEHPMAGTAIQIRRYRLERQQQFRDDYWHADYREVVE